MAYRIGIRIIKNQKYTTRYIIRGGDKCYWTSMKKNLCNPFVKKKQKNKKEKRKEKDKSI
jgi:hypothetical protein